MAPGTVLMAPMRKVALAAHRGTSPVELPAPLAPQPATCLRTAATIRRSALMERMRGAAGIASLATSGAGMRSVCMRHGCVTDSQTVLMAVMSGTVPTPCPEKSLQRRSSAAWCVACCWSSLSAAPANSMPFAPRNIGQLEGGWL